MAKKYSLQMEDDKLVSVEVDGVSYSTPDDIPDDEDREKIEAMINKAEDAGDDAAFDQAFDAQTREEFRQMEKQSSVIPWVLLAIFFGIAIINLAIAGFSAYSSSQTMAHEVSMPGQVVGIAIHSSRDSDTGQVTDYSYPIVEFTPPDQRLQHIEMSEGSSPPDYAVGDKVTILYEPQPPHNARIKSFASNLLLWILPGITLIVGAAFATAGFVTLKMWPPNRPDTPVN